MRTLPITVVAATVLLIVHPPLPVVMALEIGVIAIICIREAIGRLGDQKIVMGVLA